MKALITLLILVSLLSSCASAVNNEQHLFILSGQSNMVRMDADITFRPKLESTFGKNNVTIVKDAKGAQPISRWVKNWQAQDGSSPEISGDLYDRLITKVQAALKHKSYDTVTFIWMQGERDARKEHGGVYASSLNKLYQQLSSDLHRTDINFIIGRLSDFGFQKQGYPDWEKVRQAQVHVATQHPRGAWVNTDDLNDGISSKGKKINNDLHMSVEGYKILGNRYAEQAIKLIESNR
ncbi:sialate O-acetylesterase [Colwellia piezophila]|uniref:sialate O-acetylesterase n=1 Tax=Colwellia piezophila TaxID=211668 RepID=UPI000367B23C|nr:sialate O-acetylesterase [Colwellia piezophila]